MADRWSEPSGTHGTNRFRVWPASSDMYDHGEMADNWDMVDAIFGGPSSGTWPPPGGLYAEIQNAGGSSIPLGMCFPWFRPNLGVSVPSEFAVADGTTLNSSQHDFPDGGNVTLPDLRNRFILGADFTKGIGDAGASVDNALAVQPEGAPGPQGEGGSNAVQLQGKHLPTHNHTGSFTGWSPATVSWYYQKDNFAKVSLTGGIAPVYGNPGEFEVTQWGTRFHTSVGAGAMVWGQHRHSLSGISGSGGDVVHENRPRYIGLIWLIKVLDG